MTSAGALGPMWSRVRVKPGVGGCQQLRPDGAPATPPDTETTHAGAARPAPRATQTPGGHGQPLCAGAQPQASPLRSPQLLGASRPPPLPSAPKAGHPSPALCWTPPPAPTEASTRTG